MRRLLFAFTVLAFSSCGYPDYTFEPPDASPDTATTTSDSIVFDTRSDSVIDTSDTPIDTYVPPTNLGTGQDCTNSSECASGVCLITPNSADTSKTCQAPTCGDGVLNGSETDIDCGGSCALAGSDTGHCGINKHCAYGADCTLSSQSCSPATDGGLGVCLAPSCTDHIKNGDETDVDCGGSCDGQGFTCANTYACLTSSDCKSNLCETSGAGKVCVDAHCTDGTKDEDETDVDCGGSSCGQCANLKGCLAATDCKSGVCSASTTDAGTVDASTSDGDATETASASTMICEVPTCSDGVKNGTETDIDCGGGSCPTCADGQKCTDVETPPAASKDCKSGVCASDICAVPTCTDGIKNGDETGVDCGGSCAKNFGYTCGTNTGCTLAADCTSGVCKANLCQSPTCVDGVLNGTETDLDCGGTLCDGQSKTCADGKACAANADCKNLDCQNNKCVSCYDGKKNQDETDVDCGGTFCDALGLKCADLKACSANADCTSGVCQNSKCVSCSDGVKDQNETGVDCGGVCDALGKTCPGASGCVANADCQSLICNGGTCAAPACNDGVKNGTETGIDCGGSCDTVVNSVTGFYDLCQVTQGCSVPGDCFSKVCTASACVAPSCSDTTTNGYETDLNCGVSGTYDGSDTPPTCALCGDGKKCINNADCSFAGCHGGICDHCFSGTKNATETDVDCGGSCATGADKLTCADGKGCSVATDCTSGACQASKCVSCSDGIKNQTETDVDCGGICAPAKKCADGKGCSVAGDCTSGVCSAGKCVSCSDGIKDQTETDIDCGGVCDAQGKTCANGKGCSVNGDCAGGTCSGGICNHCADATKDGNETDIDCGGADCDALGDKCAYNKACSVNGDCQQGLCSGGKCVLPYTVNFEFDPNGGYPFPDGQWGVKIQVTNNTSTALSLANVRWRYYMTNNYSGSQTLACDGGTFLNPWGNTGDCVKSCVNQASGLTTTGAGWYIEFWIANNADGGSVGAGATTGTIEWTMRYETGLNILNPTTAPDYSFNNGVSSQSTFTPNPYIVMYQVDSQSAPTKWTLLSGIVPPH